MDQDPPPPIALKVHQKGNALGGKLYDACEDDAMKDVLLCGVRPSFDENNAVSTIHSTTKSINFLIVLEERRKALDIY